MHTDIKVTNVQSQCSAETPASRQNGSACACLPLPARAAACQRLLLLPQPKLAGKFSSLMSPCDRLFR